MAIQTTYPGVFVQEVPSRVRTIVRVGTSIACFVGRTKTGLLLTPARVRNPTDFIRTFVDDATIGDLSRYVRLFFLNAGTNCYITRIAHGAQAAAVTLRLLADELSHAAWVPRAPRQRHGFEVVPANAASERRAEKIAGRAMA